MRCPNWRNAKSVRWNEKFPNSKKSSRWISFLLWFWKFIFALSWIRHRKKNTKCRIFLNRWIRIISWNLFPFFLRWFLLLFLFLIWNDLTKIPQNPHVENHRTQVNLLCISQISSKHFNTFYSFVFALVFCSFSRQASFFSLFIWFFTTKIQFTWLETRNSVTKQYCWCCLFSLFAHTHTPNLVIN